MKRNGCALSTICKKRIIRKQFLGILFLCIFILLPGCGGGGSIYYPPGIERNTAGLQKVELSKTGITSYNRIFFPVPPTSCDDSRLRDKAFEEGRKVFNDFGYFQKVQFLGSEYYLHSNNSLPGVDMIRKSDMKKILYLPTPISSHEFASFPIAMGKQSFLAVYIEQQIASHSSTLFVIDSQFKIVYQEHLAGAKGFGYTRSGKYGNCIVLKSESYWFQNAGDKSQVWVNGDWLYYIPDTREQTNP